VLITDAALISRNTGIEISLFGGPLCGGRPPPRGPPVEVSLQHFGCALPRFPDLHVLHHVLGKLSQAASQGSRVVNVHDAGMVMNQMSCDKGVAAKQRRNQLKTTHSQPGPNCIR
jgi:hypothetical protein